MNQRHWVSLYFTGLFLFLSLSINSPAAAQQAQSKQHEEPIIKLAQTPWKGDLDAMLKRGFIRILTTYNPILFNYNGLEQRGFAVEMANAFEKYLRKSLGKKARHLNVALIVVPRDELIPRLIAGRGDIIAANLTITPERKKVVAFSKSFYRNVSELIVTGPAARPINTFDDLVHTGLYLRRSSSYFEHLSLLNEERVRLGKPQISVDPADEQLEDYDLLDLVNAGIIPAIVVDSHKAKLWAQVFKNIRVHHDLAVNTGGNIAWAMRKENPELLRIANGFKKVIQKGSLLGNILLKRYLSTKWIDNVSAPNAQTRFHSVSKFIKLYANRYGFDWLMVAAQGYQESKLDQRMKSPAGAVGIMQILPTTAADPKVGIPDIHLAEQNIHAGVKYLKVLRENYFNDQAITAPDRMFLSFGAYNAGPGNIARARSWARKHGLDPNRWFNHVEVAAARTISQEPVVYVRNILKYYVTYKKLEQAAVAREKAMEIERK